MEAFYLIRIQLQRSGDFPDVVGETVNSKNAVPRTPVASPRWRLASVAASLRPSNDPVIVNRVPSRTADMEPIPVMRSRVTPSTGTGVSRPSNCVGFWAATGTIKEPTTASATYRFNAARIPCFNIVGYLDSILISLADTVEQMMRGGKDGVGRLFESPKSPILTVCHNCAGSLGLSLVSSIVSMTGRTFMLCTENLKLLSTSNPER